MVIPPLIITLPNERTSLDRVMRQMGWKMDIPGAKCIWQGCDNSRAGELLCLWHQSNADGRKIDRTVG